MGTALSVRFLPLQHAKHTAQVPMRRSIRVAKVNQNPVRQTQRKRVNDNFLSQSEESEK